MNDQAGNQDEDSRRVKTIGEKIGKHRDKYYNLYPYARIFKVPEDLRKHNGSAYTPRLIAIGPLHRKDKHLQTPMQLIKWCYTDALISDVAENIGGDKEIYKVLGECLETLKGCICDAKKYYAEVDSPRKNNAEDVTLVCKGQKYNAEEVKVAHKARKYDSEEVTLVYKGQKDNADEVKVVHEYDASEVTPIDEADDEEMLVDSAKKNEADAEDVTLVCKGQKYNVGEVTLVYKGQKYNAEEVKVAHKVRKYDSEEVTLVYKGQKDNAKEVKVTLVDEAANDEMVEMMLVDGCFILKLLCWSYQRKVEAAKKNPLGADNGNSKGQGQIDPIFDNILTGAIIKQDLILLENQIPLFVLEHLFEVTVANISGANKLSLQEYVLLYCGDMIKRREDENSGSKKTSCCLPVDCALSVGDCVLSAGRRSAKDIEHAGEARNCYHILHLLHDFCLPSGHIENKQKKLCGLEVSASDLHYAGVNFAPAENNNPFNVEFEKPQGIHSWFHRAKFKIPTLNVDDSTEIVLRNLIALEQCCPLVRRHFTSYAKFMDMLIDSDKDVEVLKKAGVIRNNLGAHTDVARLFNNLCKDVVVGEFYFNDKYQDAYNYSKQCWPNLMAYCKRNYFASPWAFRGVVVAIIGFGIGLTQFIRSFFK